MASAAAPAGSRSIDRDLEALQAKSWVTIQSAIEEFMTKYPMEEIRGAQTSTGRTLADVCMDWWVDCLARIGTAGHDERLRAQLVQTSRWLKAAVVKMTHNGVLPRHCPM